MKMLSLFAGIGGFDLAAQWVGIETVAFCEIDKFCQQVLRKNFGAEIVIFDDVRTLTKESLHARGIERVDIVCGGFPCQDISTVGKKEGIYADRSGLWWEMLRIVRALRVRYVLVENVAALHTNGADEVKGSLEALGYICWPMEMGADAVGEETHRDRAWIAAYSSGESIIQTLAEISPKRAGWQTRHHAVRRAGRSEPTSRWKLSESDVLRDVARFPGGMGAYRAVTTAIGNSVNPRQVYPILKAIADYESEIILPSTPHT